MGGDGASGLAMAIGIAVVLLVLGALAVAVLAGRFLDRRFAPAQRGWVTAATVLAGLGLGWMLVMATFYEASWSPPPRLRLTTPAGFDAPAVILLEDPRAGRALAWSGGRLPFSAETAQIAVPRSGVVRVRSFGAMAGRADLDTVWPDGGSGIGAGGGPGPPGTGAVAYMILTPPGSSGADAPDTSDPRAFAAYIRQVEARR